MVFSKRLSILWRIVSVQLVLSCFLLAPQLAQAANQDILGIHLLSLDDLTKVRQLFGTELESTKWRYITIPFTLEDTKRVDEWQRFFVEAKKHRIIPIVRLATKFEKGAWAQPSRQDIVALSFALNQLTWPTDERYVIVFNEVNHAKEWGNQLDPAGYAQILAFTAQWLHTESAQFRILPAAMDLAAPDGRETRSAFVYFEQMLATDPDVFIYVDYWNSHSYPNPGFSAEPTRKAVNSLWGFTYELDFIKQKTGRDLKVFITETGWANNQKTRRWLAAYYAYALQHIWSDSRVMAVTPFVLKGDPGPFAEFGFLDRNDQPTLQYKALQEAILKAK